MSTSKVPFIPGKFVKGGPKRRRVKMIEVKDPETKKTLYREFSSRDVVLNTRVNKKTGEIYSFTEVVTGSRGDQNHAQHIPPNIANGLRKGRRNDKKAKKVDPNNLCHRVLSSPGAENARYVRLDKERKLQELVMAVRSYISDNGSVNGAGNNPKVAELLRQCHGLECDRTKIRRAMRGANPT